MSDEEAEGFPKRGTTLEGRTAFLFRLMGYKVSRNVVLEDHEIDVYAESENGKRVIVECKEYYTQLIPRDLILIFATKVRDINPDEAWFVTIYDFEPSARELCKRYGIIAVNGYELEELEEKAAKGPIQIRPVPSEDRLLRLLNRQRLNLKRKRQNIDELRKVAGEINELRKTPVALPPFLFPMYPSDLERQNIRLTELEVMAKTSTRVRGGVNAVVIGMDAKQPFVRGFRVLQEAKVRVAAIVAAILFIAGILLFLMEARTLLTFQTFEQVIAYGFYWKIAIVCFGVGVILLVLSNTLAYRYPKLVLKPVEGVTLKETELDIPYGTRVLEEKPSDLMPNQLIGIQVVLTDGSILGRSSNFIINTTTWQFGGVEIVTVPKIAEETGFKEAVIPIQHINIFPDMENILNIRVNAAYVLGETFSREETN